MHRESDKIYFPGLNGIRFLGAAAIIFIHVELAKVLLGSNASESAMHALNAWGWVALNSFFVLSGFLISYLLLVEKARIGTVGIKNFYIRRMLRIWPLYYLLTFLGFFIFPRIAFFDVAYLSDQLGADFSTKLALFLFLIPQFSTALFPPLPHISQLWSIGVEEQFYLVWPLCIRFSKNILRTILIVMLAVVTGKACFFLLANMFAQSVFFRSLAYVIALSRFECMLIGATAAYLVFTKHGILTLMYRASTLAISIVLLPLFLLVVPGSFIEGAALFGVPGLIINVLSALFFAVVIINVATNPRSFLKLENAALNYLGKISYGIYMYHVVIVVFVIRAATHFGFGLPEHLGVVGGAGVFLAVLALTIAISALSYKIFENPFINLKARFSKIISGDLARIYERNFLSARIPESVVEHQPPLTETATSSG